MRVLIPIPSPTKRTTPRATPPGGVVPLTLELAADARIRDSIALVAASYHTFLSANRNISSTERTIVTLILAFGKSPVLIEYTYNSLIELEINWTYELSLFRQGRWPSDKLPDAGILLCLFPRT